MLANVYCTELLPIRGRTKKRHVGSTTSMKRKLPSLQVDTSGSSFARPSKRSPLSPIQIYKEICRVPSYLRNNPIAYKSLAKHYVNTNANTKKQNASNIIFRNTTEAALECTRVLNQLSMSYRMEPETVQTIYKPTQRPASACATRTKKSKDKQESVTSNNNSTRVSFNLDSKTSNLPLPSKIENRESLVPTQKVRPRSASCTTAIKTAVPPSLSDFTTIISSYKALPKTPAPVNVWTKPIQETVSTGKIKSPENAVVPIMKTVEKPKQIETQPKVMTPPIIAEVTKPSTSTPPSPVVIDRVKPIRPLSVLVAKNPKLFGSGPTSPSPTKLFGFGSTLSSPKTPIRTPTRSPAFVPRSTQEKADSLSLAEEIIKRMEQATSALREATKEAAPTKVVTVQSDSECSTPQSPQYDKNHEMYIPRIVSLSSVVRKVATQIRVIKLFEPGTRHL